MISTGSDHVPPLSRLRVTKISWLSLQKGSSTSPRTRSTTGQGLPQVRSPSETTSCRGPQVRPPSLLRRRRMSISSSSRPVRRRASQKASTVPSGATARAGMRQVW